MARSVAANGTSRAETWPILACQPHVFLLPFVGAPSPLGRQLHALAARLERDDLGSPVASEASLGGAQLHGLRNRTPSRVLSGGRGPRGGGGGGTAVVSPALTVAVRRPGWRGCWSGSRIGGRWTPRHCHFWNATLSSKCVPWST